MQCLADSPPITFMSFRHHEILARCARWRTNAPGVKAACGRLGFQPILMTHERKPVRRWVASDVIDILSAGLSASQAAETLVSHRDLLAKLSSESIRRQDLIKCFEVVLDLSVE
jgi:hypothetical protein